MILRCLVAALLMVTLFAIFAPGFLWENLFHRIRIAASYKKHYENTHIEVLEAKRMMDELGVRSAMLVSSAYHMRRIRLIAGLVFDARKYSISCKPARWQTEFTTADWLNNETIG